MIMVRSKFSYMTITFYSICLLMAICLFYFSICAGVFAWIYPDEILASIWTKQYGPLGCAKFYYAHTTIGRIGEGLGVCLVAQSVSLFKSFLMSWAFIRLFFYALIPISMAFLLKETTSLSAKISFIIALIIFSIGFFVTTSSGIDAIYGLDLASYASTTITFFMMMTIFSKSIVDKRYFILYLVYIKH